MIEKDLKIYLEKKFADVTEQNIQHRSSQQSDLVKMIQESDKKNGELFTAQNKVINEFREDYETHKTNLKPIMDAFADSQKYKFVWTRTGVKIKSVAGWISTVGGGLALLWYFIKFLLSHSK